MNLALLNATTTKQLVIRNTFPMKVTPKIIPSTQPTSKSFPNFKILPPTYVTYEIKPTTTLKNDKVGLLLDTISDSYTELFQVSSQFKWTDKGLTLPTQNKLFFETCITNKEYKSYVSMLEHKEQETLQTLNFAWHKSAKIKVQHELVTLDKNCIGFEFKLKHTTGLSLSVDQRLKEKPIRELLEQSKLLKDTEQIFIQFGLQPAEFDWWKEADKRVKSVSKQLKATETTTSKLGCPAFDCSLRIVIKGETTQRAEMLSRGTIMALKQLNGDNELVENRIKNKKLSKWFEKYVKGRKIDTHFFRFSKRMLLTRKEIRHLIKLPERSLQVDFELGVSEREELKIHSLLRKKDGILIGHSEDKGKKVEIRIPKDNDDSFFNMNIYFGSPRVGKDVAQTNFIIESCLHANCGAIVPDVINEPVRGMADMLRDYLPKDRIVDIDFCNTSHSIYLGFEDIIHEVGVDLLSNDVVKILELDDKFDSKQLCRLVAKATNCNLYDMYCFLSSDIYATKVYKDLKESNELLALELQHKYFDKNMSSSGKAQAKKAVLTRLDDFISIDKIKYMFAQKPNDKFDLMSLMNQNKVVIIRMLKTGGLGELACRTIMHLLTTKVFWLKKIMLNTKIPSRTFIVFNEFHQFLSKGFEELLTDMMFEAPKYKLGMLMSLHNPSKISNTLWSMMQSASATMYLFKNTNYSVYRDLEAQLKPIELETAKNTQKFESIMIPYVDGKQLQPLFVRMIVPPIQRMKKLQNENVGKECHEQYGTNVNEITQYILEREMNLYKEEKSA
jgi:hypothetical protein